MTKRTKYKWESSSCAPAEYPVMVIDGILTYPKEGGMDFEFDTQTTNDWGGKANSSMGIETSIIPDGLGIRWYSYVEDKFYSGFFDLPADTIYKLFEKGFVQQSTKIPGSYTHILVGMAPHGVVSVWLHGDGVVTEVGNFKAEEIEMSMIEAFPTRLQRDVNKAKPPLQFRTEWRERIAEEDSILKRRMEDPTPIPEGLWDKVYREKFNSRVVVNFSDPTAILDMMTMSYINGEQETLMYDKMKENAFSKRPRFKEVEFRWSFGRELRESDIELDTDEMIEAYKKLSEGEPADRKYELRVDQGNHYTDIRIYMQAVGTEYPKEIELEKTFNRLYPIREASRFKFDVFRDEYEDDFNIRMLRKDRKID